MAEDEATTIPLHQRVGLVVRDDDDNDSAYQDEIESYKTSISSSIRDHTYENGRRYHSYRSGKYLAPNDEAELDRLDMHHHLATLLIDGELHVAPIGMNPQSILDVGCGTGIWAIDMGEEYPSAEVIGVDLSPTQPIMVPQNVSFMVDDVEEQWAFQSPFDLVHVRFLAAAIQDWPKLVQQTYQFTKPGGWCEFKDWDLNVVSIDNSLPENSAILKYHSLVFDGLKKVGRSHEPGPKLKKWVEAAGFERVEERVLPVPIGPWPKDAKFKDIGYLNLLCLMEGLEAIALRLLTTVLGWTTEEVLALLEQVRAELKDRRIHAQYMYYVVRGQKSENEKD